MDGRVKSSEIYDAGYAIAVYDIRHNTRTFRYRDQELTISEAPKVKGPIRWFTLTEYKGWSSVANWEDVKRAHRELS